MLRITTDQKKGRITLSVEGRLAGPSVGTLEECWRELRAASPRSKLQIHLCGVSYIDNAGKLLLAEFHRQGGQLVAEGCLNQAIIEEIVEAADAGKHARRRETRPKSGPILFWLILTTLLAPAGNVRAQDKPNPAASAQRGRWACVDLHREFFSGGIGVQGVPDVGRGSRWQHKSQ